MREVLEVLKNEKLYAKFSKCDFWIQEVQFWGHVVNQEGIMVDPAKIEVITKWGTTKESYRNPMLFWISWILSKIYPRLFFNRYSINNFDP